MITVEKLSKIYPGKKAVDNISFNVRKGEICGFLGPNGAGKSTTIKIITTFLPATSGSASLGGFDVFEDSMEVRKLIGYMPETPPLYYDLTVREFLRYVGKLKGLSGSDLDNRMKTVIGQTAVSEYENTLCSKLSKGYRQRVALAQALIHSPPHSAREIRKFHPFVH